MWTSTFDRDLTSEHCSPSSIQFQFLLTSSRTNTESVVHSVSADAFNPGPPCFQDVYPWLRYEQHRSAQTSQATESTWHDSWERNVRRRKFRRESVFHAPTSPAQLGEVSVVLLHLFRLVALPFLCKVVTE
jgi:hypothetical protein